VSRVVGWLIVGFLVAASSAGVWVARSVALEEPVGVPVLRPAAPSGKYGERVRRRQMRESLFAELQPVKLRNCELARFGEKHDGGYLVCANLLKDVGSAYSYGISGYDGWGCDISTRLNVPVHQYDCFNTTRPSCPSGRPVFHAECVAGGHSVDGEGRLFDSLQRQFGKNGDADKHLVVKMDVEGAEWDSILETPDEVLDRVDQLVFEFHGIDRNSARYLEVVTKLKRTFEIVHLHFNNYSCLGGGAPFPAWAYEVTLVNKRLAEVDPAQTVTLPNPLDTPNQPVIPDCQSLAILD
jgi:hypothetical protein